MSIERTKEDVERFNKKPEPPRKYEDGQYLATMSGKTGQVVCAQLGERCTGVWTYHLDTGKGDCWLADEGCCSPADMERMGAARAARALACHDDLVAALKECEGLLKDLARRPRSSFSASRVGSDADEILISVKAALAKAGLPC